MLQILNTERKRILNFRILFGLLLIVILISGIMSYFEIKKYDIRDNEGIIITWKENLEYSKKEMKGKTLNTKYLEAIKNKGEQPLYAYQINLQEIIRMNYGIIELQDLTKDDINNFYLKRLDNIELMLTGNSKTAYTQEEVEQFMDKAKEISEVPFSYAEGWKELNNGLGSFVSILLIIIAVILLPLVGIDLENNMTELYRSTKNGKRKLDNARVIVAFLCGSLLYFIGIVVHFIVRMLPFGYEGWSQCIQSNSNTFLSIYNITNLQQFLMNVAIGFVALLFTVALVLLITTIIKGIMPSAVILTSFWILLLLFEQFSLWEVNHFFANFMPLRMANFSHYYIGNEIYRICGSILSCMKWNSILTIGVTIGIILIVVILGRVYAKEKC